MRKPLQALPGGWGLTEALEMLLFPSVRASGWAHEIAASSWAKVSFLEERVWG